MNKIQSALAALVLTTASALSFINATHETMVLKGEVSDESMKALTDKMTNDPFLLKRFMNRKLIIDSPGGSVDALDFFKTVEDLEGGKLVTVTNNLAASAASTIFLLGDERLVGENAEILIHEVRVIIGNLPVTYSDLKSVLEHNKLAPNSQLEGKRLSMPMGLMDVLISAPQKQDPNKTVVDDIKEIFGDQLKDVVDNMSKTHETMIKFLMKRLNKSREFVTSKLLVTNTDISLDAKQALEVGVATGRA